MQKRTLGKTDIKLDVITFSAWAIAGKGDLNWGDQDEQQAIDAIRAAIDVGMTTFDTAPGYGNGSSESILGKAIGPDRDKVTLLTKLLGDQLKPQNVANACDESLQRLNTDRIDLYQIHWPNRDVPFADTFAELEKLKDAGKIRAIGVSNFGPKDMASAADTHRFESNQLCYSLLFRAVEFDIQPKCLDEQTSILCYSPLAQGLLTGKFTSIDQVPEGRKRSRHFSTEQKLARHGEQGCEQLLFATVGALRGVCQRIGQPMSHVALAWLLAQPGVTSVLAGARSPEQVQSNVKAAALSLSPDVIEELNQVTDELKQTLGSNADPWMGDSRMK